MNLGGGNVGVVRNSGQRGPQFLVRLARPRVQRESPRRTAAFAEAPASLHKVSLLGLRSPPWSILFLDRELVRVEVPFLPFQFPQPSETRTHESTTNKPEEQCEVQADKNEGRAAGTEDRGAEIGHPVEEVIDRPCSHENLAVLRVRFGRSQIGVDDGEVAFGY